MKTGESLGTDELEMFGTLADRPPIMARHTFVAYDASGTRYRIISDELNPLCAYSQTRQEGEYSVALDDDIKRYYARLFANNESAVGIMVGHTRSPQETVVHFAYCRGCLHANLIDASRVAYPARQAYNAWHYGFAAGVNSRSDPDLLRIDIEYGADQATYNAWTPVDCQSQEETTRIERYANDLAEIIDFALHDRLRAAAGDVGQPTASTTKPAVVLRNDYWELGPYEITTAW